MKNFYTLLILFLLLNCSHLGSKEPFQARVTLDGVSETVSAPNLVDLNRDLRSDNLQELFFFYTPASPLSIDINLRGLIALTSFAENSTTLSVTIPNAGITRTFEGGTREASLTLFKDFIKEGDSLPRLLKAYARYSPIDPIAGNPNSLLAQMAESDFLLAALSPLAGCSTCWTAQPILHQFQAGLWAGRGFSKEFDTTRVTFPLRYSYSPDRNWAFILDAPLSYNRNGGASSLFGSFGIGLRAPLLHPWWSLTPIIRFGAGGTLDLCTSGSFFSAGVTSNIDLKICDYIISIINYAGYFTSTNLWLTGLNFNYHLHNHIYKNGISLNSCNFYSFLGRPINFKLSFTDSYFAGDRLFIQRYDEVEASAILNNINPCLCYDSLSIGFAFQWGEKNYRGYFLKTTYQF